MWRPRVRSSRNTTATERVPDQPGTEANKNKRRPAFGRAAFVILCAALFGAYRLVTLPDTPLPAAWNPIAPLSVSDPITPLTQWKLNRALATPELCLQTLMTGAVAQPLPDLVESAQCGIADQVLMSGVSGADLAPLNTRCQTALRMAMWMEHGVHPAAEQHFGQRVARVNHISSYSCRPIRTPRGPSARMSTHARAEAVDIAGFVLSDGTRISLLESWGDDGPAGAFLADVRTAACTWFRLTLGPSFNRLHADHFHLQHRGSGLCR